MSTHVQVPVLGVPLFTAEQCQQLDRHCIDELGMDGYELMQQAAQTAFAVLLSEWPSLNSLIILCGKGNNGGDGFEMASIAHDHGIDIQLVFDGDLSSIQGEAKQAAQKAQSLGLETIPSSQIDWEKSNCVIVDALLGTGSQGAPRGHLINLIDAVNHSGLPVLAVDIPSGINANTGYCEGVAIKANITVTMLLNKQGLYTAHARDYVGDIRLAPLAVPPSIKQAIAPSCYVGSWQKLKTSLPSRALSAHKGHFGHVLLIGGDHGMAGAISLAAAAALRVGAGLVSVATRAENVSAIVSRQPEVMAHAINSGQQVAALIEKADLIAIGPGLGQSSWGQQMLQQAMLSTKPIVIDADGLNLLAQGRIQHNLSQRISVITPHPGEAARLLNTSSGQIEHDRFHAVNELSERYASQVVLKGAGTLIGDKTKITICGDGNPGMASGGMGDVLTGVLAGLLAQYQEQLDEHLHEYVSAAVCLHSASADEAAKLGIKSLLASDLLVELRQLLN